MEIELVPDPGVDDPAWRAVAAALARADMMDDLRLAASEGAWRCSGLKDAVERSVNPAGAIPSFVPSGCVPSGCVPTGYVPPPRSARGAPRA